MSRPASRIWGNRTAGRNWTAWKLGAGEGAEEEAEGHAEQGVGDREQDDRPAGPVSLHVEGPEGDRTGDAALDRGEQREGNGVAEQEVELGER